jgi:VanZ family protein
MGWRKCAVQRISRGSAPTTASSSDRRWESRRMLRWVAVLLWMGGIFVLSSIPSLHSPFGYDFLLRKLAHMGVYAGLTVLLFLALRQHTDGTRRAWLLAVLLAGAYALTDEWHQTIVPGRHGTFRDVGIDMLGVAAGYTLTKAARIFNSITGSIDTVK